MKELLKKVLSHDAPPIIQFIKYGIVGVLSTLIQILVFYIAACTFLKCLTQDDVFLKFLDMLGAATSNLAVNDSDSIRAFRAAVATGIGFFFANIFCWIMNRLFVFKPGRHFWLVELVLFFCVSLAALSAGIVVQTVLINCAGWTTSSAFIIEIFSSFIINYVVRKFFIFKG